MDSLIKIDENNTLIHEHIDLLNNTSVIDNYTLIKNSCYKKQLIKKDSNLFDIENVNILHHINQSLKARNLFRKDVDYLVRDNQVLIIDEFTGRIMVGRRWSDGLHQAVEAKEGVVIQQESKTYATITFQNFFRLYKVLSGGSGTVLTEAEEFFTLAKNIYFNWSEIVNNELKGYREERLSTDNHYAVTAQVFGRERCTLPLDFINFVHMKPAINNFSTERAWFENVMHERDGDMIRINNLNQYSPVHYYDKTYATKELIEYYESRRA